GHEGIRGNETATAGRELPRGGGKAVHVGADFAILVREGDGRTRTTVRDGDPWITYLEVRGIVHLERRIGGLPEGDRRPAAHHSDGHDNRLQHTVLPFLS